MSESSGFHQNIVQFESFINVISLITPPDLPKKKKKPSSDFTSCRGFEEQTSTVHPHHFLQGKSEVALLSCLTVYCGNCTVTDIKIQELWIMRTAKTIIRMSPPTRARPLSLQMIPGRIYLSIDGTITRTEAGSQNTEHIASCHQI